MQQTYIVLLRGGIRFSRGAWLGRGDNLRSDDRLRMLAGVMRRLLLGIGMMKERGKDIIANCRGSGEKPSPRVEGLARQGCGCLRSRLEKQLRRGGGDGRHCLGVDSGQSEIV